MISVWKCFNGIVEDDIIIILKFERIDIKNIIYFILFYRFVFFLVLEFFPKEVLCYNYYLCLFEKTKLSM